MAKISVPNTTIKVVVVDDHPFFRQGVRDVLNAEPDIEVIGESGDGYAALDMIKELKPDVVLLDVNLPKLNGLQITQTLKRARSDVNVIIHDKGVDPGARPKDSAPRSTPLSSARPT